MIKSLIILFCFYFLFVSSSPYFTSTLSSNPNLFSRNVLNVWENLFGNEFMHSLDDKIYNNYNNRLFNSTNYMVPMSDGVKLNTIVNFPAGYNGEPLPVVLDRTPYDAEAYQYIVGTLFHFRGYIAVAQDMRGCFASEGEWSYWRKSASDGFDTINWIAEQPWSNGEVMAFGVSADGIAATCEEGHIPPPPALKAQSLWVASGDGYESTYYNGAYREALISGWLENLGEGSYIDTVLEHEAYGPWWYPIDLSFRWNNTNVPAVHSGGWYDIFAQGTIDAFNGYQYKGGQGAKGNQYLIMNPLGHCGGGEYRFPRGRNLWMLDITYNMFEQAQSITPYSSTSKSICFYVLGPNPRKMSDTDSGNFWACMDEFLPYTPTDYYFHPQGFLMTSPMESSSAPASNSFIYDPSYPVPTIGGNNLNLPTCGPYDQTDLELRADVLTFTTPILEEAVAITGNVSVTLYVSSNATDTDFTAKLTDVYDNKSFNILDNVIRMRWRNSLSTISLMTPGQIYEVTIDMTTTSYVFNVGHQIRLDISSSNYPRFSANFNNGNTIIEGGAPVIAENTIYYDNEHQTKLILPVVPLSDLTNAASSPF